MKRLVAVIGDYYHAEEHLRQALETMIEQFGLQDRYVLEYATTETLKEVLFTDPDCFILAKENRLNPKDPEPITWMTEDLAAAITHYVETGGSIIAWHSGLANYGKTSPYTRLIRGYFEYHPREHQLVTYAPADEEQKESHGFSIVDEHYFVYVDQEHTEVTHYSESIDGRSIAGWRHRFGQGKVCAFTPAHRLESLLDRAVLGDLKQLIDWCCADD